MKYDLTEAERTALTVVMCDRYDNVVETRRDTGDDEYDSVDEDQCSALAIMLNDFDYDPDTVSSVEHLHTAIWIALDTDGYLEDERLDLAALRSAAVKIGYEE